MTDAEYITMNTQILQIMMMLFMVFVIWGSVRLIQAIEADIKRKKLAAASTKSEV